MEIKVCSPFICFGTDRDFARGLFLVTAFNGESSFITTDKDEAT